MRLEKIKLAGFKSFVDPTTVEFPSNLVGVVGPNGCGKSNVIDAVRWVMGESSAKNLRGESITDVIFNGTTSRKPVGQASIELVFDNREGKLGGEYAKYAEISIKRVVNRDAQSSYYLNGTKCRRRDISDVFLGTGLGPRSYSIIQQGTVSKLIEAKPEELRVHLEEVSGISKYKERRRETETRIKHTKENLARLSDLRDELDKQLQHLQRQATAAERYKVLKEEERLLRARGQALRWQSLDQQMKGTSLNLQEEETALESHVAEQQNIDTRITQLREAEHDVAEQYNQIQAQYYQMGNEITRLEQSMEHFKERHAQLRQDLAQAEQAWEELKQHSRYDNERLQDLEKEIAELEPTLMLAREKAQMTGERLVQAEQQMREWQTDWDNFNQRAAKSSEVAQVEQARIQQIEQRQSTARKRLEAIVTEQQQLNTDNLEQELNLLQEQHHEAEDTVTQATETLQAGIEKINHLRTRQHEVQNELDDARSELQTQKGKQASLQALQQEALGKKVNQVNQWLEKQGIAKSPRLAELIKVEAGWEQAAEVVLGPYLEAVCVENMPQLAEALQELTDGNLSLFNQSSSSNVIKKEQFTSLNEKVKGSSAVANMLQTVYIAETVQEALSLLPQLLTQESIVCRDGVWLSQSWLRVNKNKDVHSGILRREQELRDIQTSIEELTLQVASKEEELNYCREQLHELEMQRDEQQQMVNQARAQLADLKAQISVRQARIEQLKHRHQRLQTEADELHDHLTEAHEELLTARSTWQQAMTDMEKDADLREELLAKRDTCRETLDHAQQAGRDEKDNLHQYELRHQTSQSQINSLRQNLERMQQQEKSLQMRCETLHESLAEGDAPLDDMRLQLEVALQKRLTVEQELNQVKQHLDESQHQVRELAMRRSQVDQRISTLRDTLEQKRLQSQELKVRCHTLQEQLVESGFDIQQVLSEIPEGLEEHKVNQDLEQTVNRIQRLGPINLAAIEEYQTQAERKTYLDAQNKDLEEALNTLENAIRKIDKETRDRFKETFDTVNAYFQDYFPRVFGGGQAYLELTGEDLLDTGVAVMARPPGKKNSTIHLLSGGEKALTAIALVFSMFQLNPAPFCMLDEVDAPLDDTNVGRYCRLVKEMSDKVQFIFITHNKVAMEMAKQLTGVTMHEPGVSRIVSVDIEEAAVLAEA